MKRNQSGFTLIEIAIVLVIIGLLLGGVLKGQELINSAKVKNLASDFKNTALFIYSYQDKYHALPGDDAQASAHVSSAVVATLPAGKQGDGKIDGKWDLYDGSKTESVLFWQHVRLSGIANGSTDYTDTTSGAFPQRNTTGGLVGVTNSTDMVINGAGGTTLKGAYIICSAGILGKFAKQLDIALDDGNTATGSMMTITGTASGATAETNPDDSTLYTVCQGV